MGHIELSRSADLVVVAPATANLLAKMAMGIADDLASTALLATDKKILMAPAMNVRMWESPSVRRNAEIQKQDGVMFVGPNDGEMACGEFGPGRMAEPMEIVAAIESALKSQQRRAGGFSRPGDGGPHPGAAGPCPLSRQPLFRQTGLCDRRSLGAGRSRNRAGVRPRGAPGAVLTGVKLLQGHDGAQKCWRPAKACCRWTSP